jgi:hypothetical protein
MASKFGQGISRGIVSVRKLAAPFWRWNVRSPCREISRYRFGGEICGIVLAGESAVLSWQGTLQYRFGGIFAVSF